MSSWLIAAIGVVYLIVAVDQAFKGSIPMAITYASYAFGNVGLCLAVK